MIFMLVDFFDICFSRSVVDSIFHQKMQRTQLMIQLYSLPHTIIGWAKTSAGVMIWFNGLLVPLLLKVNSNTELIKTLSHSFISLAEKSIHTGIFIQTDLLRNIVKEVFLSTAIFCVKPKVWQVLCSNNLLTSPFTRIERTLTPSFAMIMRHISIVSSGLAYITCLIGVMKVPFFKDVLGISHIL